MLLQIQSVMTLQICKMAFSAKSYPAHRVVQCRFKLLLFFYSLGVVLFILP